MWSDSKRFTHPISSSHEAFAAAQAARAALVATHEAEKAALLAAQADELKNIEAKVAAKLQAQAAAEEEKVAELAGWRAKNAQLERALAEARARDVLRRSDDVVAIGAHVD